MSHLSLVFMHKESELAYTEHCEEVITTISIQNCSSVVQTTPTENLCNAFACYYYSLDAVDDGKTHLVDRVP